MHARQYIAIVVRAVPKSCNQIEVLATDDLNDFCIDLYLLLLFAFIAAWSRDIRNRERHSKARDEGPVGALVAAEAGDN